VAACGRLTSRSRNGGIESIREFGDSNVSASLSRGVRRDRGTYQVRPNFEGRAAIGYRLMLRVGRSRADGTRFATNRRQTDLASITAL
jgi:hypothetical protein